MATLHVDVSDQKGKENNRESEKGRERKEWGREGWRGIERNGEIKKEEETTMTPLWKKFKDTLFATPCKIIIICETFEAER